MKLNFTYLILFFVCQLSIAQTKVADNFFRDFNYDNAAELYKEALKKEDSTEHILSRLGDCYFNISKVKEAAFWYKKAIDKYPNINSDYVYKYIQTLRAQKKYEEAIEFVKIFNKNNKKDRRIKDIEKFNLDTYSELSSTDKVYVEIENLPLNTKYSDFGSFEKDNKLYFYSTWVKDSITNEKELYELNNEPYLNIFESEITIENNKKVFSNAAKLNSEINTKNDHEGLVTITNDGNTMYFTRNNVNKKEKRRYNKSGSSNLKLYKATKVDNTWTNIEELPFNNENFDFTAPTLTPDNKTLIFSSNMDSGYGQTDLYKVAINDDGTFGEPINLGPKINTEGNEKFPFVAKDSTLYFSSDANINLGLLDIFESNILKTNTDIEVKNIGAPFNSSFDDFCYFIDTETNTGYFSSNREGGQGGDDIYAFGKLKCEQIVKGLIRDELTNELLSKATVSLINIDGKILERYQTKEDGYYEFKIDCEKTYTILAEKPIYRPDNIEFETSTINQEETEIDLSLKPLIIDNEIVINPIFFDFDKSNIRPDAAYELENIVAVMREHPKMVIKIESHTDSRGNDSYNMKLSDRRAKSTRDYLFSRGIAKDRIQSAIGYGESQILNRCKNGVKCTDEEHEENRRSKFIITNNYK
ncbi:OmpA family protein [Mesoflavibacter zeaxanthinifaciens]|uniref:OmpA family protein n=1 Tax=Mesoflavibacter zeaxanthinifaciens TaxID=393060 RepID=UPI0026F0C66E|nr:OmpA family protein [Mesoflavibacter zeaxanthinifaciens]